MQHGTLEWILKQKRTLVGKLVKSNKISLANNNIPMLVS